MNIETIEDAVEGFVVLALEGITPQIKVIWGDQHGPAPEEPYAAVFLTGIPNVGQDQIIQIADDISARDGMREGRVDIRIYGPGAMNAAAKIPSAAWIEEKTAGLDAAGVVVFDEIAPQTIDYVRSGRMNKAAATGFSIRWIDSETFDRGTIETVDIGITAKTPGGDRVFEASI